MLIVINIVKEMGETQSRLKVSKIQIRLICIRIKYGVRTHAGTV